MKNWLPYLPMTIFALVIGYFLIKNSGKPKKNPREMNGRTILKTKDSIYFIRFEIDSVLAKDYDPPESPE